MEIDEMTPGQILADANVADFIGQLGLSIAEAQRALDENSISQIAAFLEPRESLADKSLLDLGLSPAFYHYQHADIACALQINLRVEKDLSVGLNLNGSLNDAQTSESESESSSSETSSGSSQQSLTRTANVSVQSASTGQLTINGRDFALDGDDPFARIRNLQKAVTSDATVGVPRLLYETTPQNFTITSDPLTEKIHVGSNTVAFIGGGFDRALIQIDANVDTVYNLDDSPAVSVASTAQADLAAYANHVDALISAEGYETFLFEPGHYLKRFHYNTNDSHLEEFTDNSIDRNEDYDDELRLVAQMATQQGLTLEIRGWADAQQFRGVPGPASNLRLSDDRAKDVMRRLSDRGVPAGNMTANPNGDADALADVNSNGGPRNNINFRKTEIFAVGRTAFWLLVKSPSSALNLNAVTPNKLTLPLTSGNGFFYLYNHTPMGLTGTKVTIDGTDFSISGAAGGGFANGAPSSHAFNLSQLINGNAAVDFTSSAEESIVTIFGKTQPFQLILATTETRSINMQSTEGIEITSQFTRARSQSASQQNTGNRTVAIGASLDVRFSRQFESNITGNSSISARLVSIPAPPQFLETIREFLQSDGG